MFLVATWRVIWEFYLKSSSLVTVVIVGFEFSPDDEEDDGENDEQKGYYSSQDTSDQGD